MENIELKSNEYNCQNCGYVLQFSPQDKALKCEKCKTTYPLPYNKEFEKHNYEKNTNESAERNKWLSDNKVFKCNNCGSSIVANKYEISNTCPYCGTNLVLDKNNLPGLKPDAIVPFSFDKETANQRFINIVRKKFYVSGAFKKHLPENKIKGTYIPSFTFDMQTKTIYDGVLTRAEKTQTQVVYNTFTINGTLDKKYEKVLVESSSKITQTQLNNILPYDLSGAIKYENKFILGYTVEHYADTLKTCEEIARTVISRLIRKDILSKYTYSSVVSFSAKTDYSNKKYSYVLVPIYKFEYSYKNKPFVTYMNGQNGKIDNNLPKSVPKIILTFLIILLIILLPFILSLTKNE